LTRLEIEQDSLVVLVGASASGKSYWAHTHFRATQVVSSDRCRALVSDDEAEQGVNRQAFAVFYTLIRQRLSLGRLTVADSTSLEPFARERLRDVAAEQRRPAHAVLFLAAPEQLLRHNRERSRRVPEPVLLRHAEQTRALAESGALETEGFASVHRLEYPYQGAVVCLPERSSCHPEPSEGSVVDRLQTENDRADG
jgi:protein phosphatase